MRIIILPQNQLRYSFEWPNNARLSIPQHKNKCACTTTSMHPPEEALTNAPPSLATPRWPSRRRMRRRRRRRMRTAATGGYGGCGGGHDAAKRWPVVPGNNNRPEIASSFSASFDPPSVGSDATVHLRSTSDRPRVSVQDQGRARRRGRRAAQVGANDGPDLRLGRAAGSRRRNERRPAESIMASTAAARCSAGFRPPV